MKIYTVTYLNHNYGSILQAYALQQKLLQLGGEPVILQRRKNKKYKTAIKSFVKLLMPKKNYSLYERIKLEIQKNKYSEKNRKLNSFISNHLIVKMIAKPEEIITELSSDSILLAGSDQIWSMINGPLNDWYTFNWKGLPSNIMRFSYAASIGLAHLENDQKEIYRNKLKGFKKISLREEQAANELRPVLGNDVRCDIDPTLFFGADFWEEISADRLENRPYIFVYMLRPDNRIIDMARALALEKNCTVIYTGLLSDNYKGVKTVCNAGVEDFISYIMHAEYVLTNSFHGTVFSVLFEKQFLSVKISSTSSRVENLLEKTGLTDRLISDPDDISRMMSPINYATAHKALEKERSYSEKYLREIIQTR